jgi:hypothetical protein
VLQIVDKIKAVERFFDGRFYSFFDALDFEKHYSRENENDDTKVV